MIFRYLLIYFHIDLSPNYLLTSSLLITTSYSNRNSRPNYFEIAQEEEGGKKKPVGVFDFVRNASIAAMTGYWQVVGNIYFRFYKLQ